MHLYVVVLLVMVVLLLVLGMYRRNCPYVKCERICLVGIEMVKFWECVWMGLGGAIGGGCCYSYKILVLSRF